jgi:acyl carrier protein
MKTPESDLVCRLIALLEQTTDGRIVVPPDCTGPDSIRNAVIDSLDLLNFLVAVEDEFGIEWHDDVPKETIHSFQAMADHIGKELGLVA